MNHIEASILLKERVKWQKPLGSAFDYLDFGEVPESGRFLQEEHPAVRIPIIYETLFDVSISNEVFQAKLEYMKQKAILQMLHDVFSDQKSISDAWINDNLGLFDYAIILKNTSNTIFDIMNSTRINLTEKVTGENLQRWFIDLNGLKDTKNGVYSQGFTDRYKREISRIRKALFMSNKSLKVITAR